MYRWRVRRPLCVDQVGNGPDDGVDLAPASDAPAAAVVAAWMPVLPGQPIPMVGEHVYGEVCCCDESCDCC